MSNIKYYDRPGVYSSESSFFPLITGTSDLITGVVFEAEKGPTVPLLLNEYDDFTKLYGKTNNIAPFAHNTILDFVKKASPLLCLRVTNNALYSTANVFNFNTSTKYENFLSGSPSNYETGERHFVVVDYPDFLENDEVNITLNGNALTTITFDGSVITTHSQMVEAINALITIELDGVVGGTEIKQVENNSYKIVAPYGVELTFDSFKYTRSPDEIDINVNTDNLLFNVFAEGPGATTSNNLGFKIVEIDQGTSQRDMIEFSTNLISGNTVNISIDGQSLTPIIFDTDHMTTMDLIVTALENYLNDNFIGEAEVQSVITNNQLRSIEVIYPNARKDFTLEVNVTGGSSQPTTSALKVSNRFAPSELFKFQVFQKPDIYNPIEEWEVSLKEIVDGNGMQLNIAHQVNDGDRRSIYVRVSQPESSKNDKFIFNPTSNIVWLQGGTVGDKVNEGQMISAIQSLNNKPLYGINVLFNAGYVSNSIRHAYENLAQEIDAFAVLDSKYSTAEGAIKDRKFELNLNTSFACLETGMYEIIDQETGLKRIVYRSGDVAAAIVNTVKTKGYNQTHTKYENGIVRGVIGLSNYYSYPEQVELSRNQVNYASKEGNALIRWEDQTLLSERGPLSAIPTRIALNYHKSAIERIAKYQLGRRNTPTQWQLLVDRINDFLEVERINEVLENFKVLSTSLNNPKATVEAGTTVVSVFLQYTNLTRAVQLNYNILGTSLSIDELIAEGVF